MKRDLTVKTVMKKIQGYYITRTEEAAYEAAYELILALESMEVMDLTEIHYLKKYNGAKAGMNEYPDAI